VGFLAALVTKILQKLIAWFLSLLAKEIKHQEKIKSDNAGAVKNEHELENSIDDLERHKKTEDLLNGH